MSWFSREKETVTVEFIESGTDIPFAVSEVPIGQLPDTFEIETNLEISGRQWIVVQAIPGKKEEFVKDGKLRIILNKIQQMYPKEILFSLPTINDEIFQLEPAQTENLLLIHEDDWRQIEFVSKQNEPKIAEEINAITEIYKNHRQGTGFNKIHIRKLIGQPLINGEIELEDLMKTFQIVKQYDGFGVFSGKGRAVNSFAFQIAEGLSFYGQSTKDDDIEFLCMTDANCPKEPINKIIEKYNVVYIDWCQAETHKS